MSFQLPPASQPAASSSQSAASSSSSSSGSSISPSSSLASEGSHGSCAWVAGCKRTKRSRRKSGASSSGRSAADKEAKNAREKERVRIVGTHYKELHTVLGDRVERGSGHFSKVRVLAAAIKYIEELNGKIGGLSEELGDSPNSPEVS